VVQGSENGLMKGRAIHPKMASHTEQGDSSESDGRTEPVKSYVSEATLKELDREADQRGMSRSSLIETYIRRGLRQDREDELEAQSRAARELQDVIDQGLDDFRDVARQIQDLNAKTGVYSAATFELLKQGHPDSTVQDALSVGSRRLRDDVDVEDTDSSVQSDDLQEDDQSEGFWDD